ncbi:MAG: indolepyruvate ferredoxin oxidoreductase subunit alpha [Bacillota bacterium]
MKKFLMGNEAIALGAIRAGVKFVAGYPGTPSTEILETIAKHNKGDIYVEWSINEKAAMEVGAGAAYSGARTLVTMKQVGLNVASDPLMSLAYVGVKGGMVIISADDPGPISSQTEQDTRRFAGFSKLPVFDPSTPEEAYLMIEDAFNYSEKYLTPVLFRPTTRVCHGSATIELLDKVEVGEPEGFIKDTKRWVIFPRSSYLNHIKIEKRNPVIGSEFSSYRFNGVVGSGNIGIASGGVSYQYTQEALNSQLGLADSEYSLLKISTPYPYPDELALQFLRSVKSVIVIEELDTVIEDGLIALCGIHNLDVKILGKKSGHVQLAGENSVESVTTVLATYFNIDKKATALAETPALPIRPPVLCAGCPHRASFYAVKRAMKGKKANFCGDIGCYTLGNAQPLDMTDTCLCMGAGINIAQGLERTNKDSINFAFVGDSTFFAAGLTGVVNAVYNQSNMVLIILDNATTAMTGHQPHPGTGVTMMGEVVNKIAIAPILTAMGVVSVQTVDPLDLQTSIEAVKLAAETKGVTAIIFKSPCIAVTKPSAKYCIDNDVCINCKRCIKELGCPAIVIEDGKVKIEQSLCFGCSLCTQVCPKDAILRKEV